MKQYLPTGWSIIQYPDGYDIIRPNGQLEGCRKTERRAVAYAIAARARYTARGIAFRGTIMFQRIGRKLPKEYEVEYFGCDGYGIPIFRVIGHDYKGPSASNERKAIWRAWKAGLAEKLHPLSRRNAERLTSALNQCAWIDLT